MIDLLKETISQINLIGQSLETIKVNAEKSEESKDKILGNDEDKGLLKEIQEAYNEVFGVPGDSSQIGKLQEIKEVYNQILVDEDDNENQSFKTQIEGFINSIDRKKQEFDDLKLELLGGQIEDENGEKIETKGLYQELRDFFDEQELKYKNFFQKIENELKGGTTSIILAKGFSDKVRAYKITGVLWQGGFFISILFLIDQFNKKGINTDDWYKFLMDIISNIPIFILSIWLLIFISNRRAEAKKLEESYKHKEVMATSYFGYKQTIEELEKGLEDDDKLLMKEHMGNLLNAIKKDNSLFLSSKGENHPFIDLFKNISKKSGIPKFNGTLENDTMKIDINNK